MSASVVLLRLNERSPSFSHNLQVGEETRNPPPPRRRVKYNYKQIKCLFTTQQLQEQSEKSTTKLGCCTWNNIKGAKKFIVKTLEGFSNCKLLWIEWNCVIQYFILFCFIFYLSFSPLLHDPLYTWWQSFYPTRALVCYPRLYTCFTIWTLVDHPSFGLGGLGHSNGDGGGDRYQARHQMRS